jgi:hypothetical protein
MAGPSELFPISPMGTQAAVQGEHIFGVNDSAPEARAL